MAAASCAVAGCSAPVRARGWCTSHYNRWHRYGDPVAGPATVAACLSCAGDLPGQGATGPRSSYCSRECRDRASYERRRNQISAERRERIRLARQAKICPGCGDAFVPQLSRAQLYCCEPCARRVHNASRRARTKGAPDGDRLHWRILAAEDGPACHICSFDTDPTDLEVLPSGARRYGPGYPTMDHVVALAVGGRHERANVRLAHLYCNTAKGARPLSEVA